MFYAAPETGALDDPIATSAEGAGVALTSRSPSSLLTGAMVGFDMPTSGACVTKDGGATGGAPFVGDGVIAGVGLMMHGATPQVTPDSLMVSTQQLAAPPVFGIMPQSLPPHRPQARAQQMLLD